MLVDGITSHIPDVVRNGDPERNYPGDASCLCEAPPMFPSHSAVVVLLFVLIFAYVLQWNLSIKGTLKKGTPL